MPRNFFFDRDDDFDPEDPESLLKWAKWLNGKTLRDSLRKLSQEKQEIALEAIERIANAKILGNGAYKGPKGKLGILVEIIHFGLSPDSASVADLRDAGLELKVTGLKKNQSGVRAKERLSLGMIDYRKSVSESPDFESDHEIQKSLSGMLLMTYWYNSRTTNPLDLVFHDSFIWKPIGEERALIKKDWALIQASIRSGFAHMLSERYSNALGAPPKGAGKDTDFLKQPIEKPFSYKQAEDVMTKLGVEQSQAKYIVKDYSERAKLPGASRSGYTLPKDRTLISKLGQYPARRRCYSLTNSYLSRLVKEKLRAK
jgi:DNA mismatch repair protein MutH